jgi:hypothetical protein
VKGLTFEAERKNEKNGWSQAAYVLQTMCFLGRVVYSENHPSQSALERVGE